MEKDQFKRKWGHLKNSVKKKWNKLTSKDLDQVNGNYSIMLTKIQARHGLTKEQAERELLRWAEQQERDTNSSGWEKDPRLSRDRFASKPTSMWSEERATPTHRWGLDRDEERREQKNTHQKENYNNLNANRRREEDYGLRSRNDRFGHSGEQGMDHFSHHHEEKKGGSMGNRMNNNLCPSCSGRKENSWKQPEWKGEKEWRQQGQKRSTARKDTKRAGRASQKKRKAG